MLDQLKRDYLVRRLDRAVKAARLAQGLRRYYCVRLLLLMVWAAILFELGLSSWTAVVVSVIVGSVVVYLIEYVGIIRLKRPIKAVMRAKSGRRWVFNILQILGVPLVIVTLDNNTLFVPFIGALLAVALLVWLIARLYVHRSDEQTLVDFRGELSELTPDQAVAKFKQDARPYPYPEKSLPEGGRKSR